MSVNAVESLTPFEFWARNDKDGKDEQDLMGDNAPYAAAYRTITGGPHTPLAPFLPAQQLRRAGHRFERLTLPFSLRRHKRRRGLDRLDDPIKHLPSGRSLFWPRLTQSPMRDNPATDSTNKIRVVDVLSRTSNALSTSTLAILSVAF